MHDQSTSIANFLSAAGAKQPTPGGGAVAALAGALAASMGEMVLQYSVAKKDLAAHASLNGEVLAKLTKTRGLLLQLMADDQAVFETLTAAKKAGFETKDVVEGCITVPLTIGDLALIMLDLANQVAGTSNKWLLSDLFVCGELAMATVRSAMHSVRANLGEVSAERKIELNGECEQMLSRAVAAIQKLSSAITAAKG